MVCPIDWNRFVSFIFFKADEKRGEVSGVKSTSSMHKSMHFEDFDRGGS